MHVSRRCRSVKIGAIRAKSSGSKSKSKPRRRYTRGSYHKSRAPLLSAGKWGYGMRMQRPANPINLSERNLWQEFHKTRRGRGGGERKDNSHDFHPPTLLASFNHIPNRIVKGFFLFFLFYPREDLHSLSPSRKSSSIRFQPVIMSNRNKCRRSSPRPSPLLVTPRLPCKIHSPFITIMTLRWIIHVVEGTTFVECSSPASVRLTCISRGNLPSLKRAEVAFHGTEEASKYGLIVFRCSLLSFFHLVSTRSR